MRLPRFQFFSPNSLDEACTLLHAYRGEAKILAGGTDLLVDLKKKIAGRGPRAPGCKVPRYIIGLSNITEAARIEYSPDKGLSLGPMTSYADVADNALVKEHYPLLWQACRTFSRPQIRHAGTLVGNLCNASPSADIIPPLIALAAKATIAGANGKREILVEDFCLDAFKSVLGEAEMAVGLTIPESRRPYGWSYQRMTKRTAEDEALVVVAAMLGFANEMGAVRQARIALGSVAPRPTRARQAETILEGKKLDSQLIQEAAEIAAREATPRSRAAYRRGMIVVLVKKALTEALGDKASA